MSDADKGGFDRWVVETSAAYRIPAENATYPDQALLLYGHTEVQPAGESPATIIAYAPPEIDGATVYLGGKASDTFNWTFGTDLGYQVPVGDIFVADREHRLVGSLEEVVDSFLARYEFSDDAERYAARDAVLNFPVPQFGSPPETFEVLKNLAATSPVLGAVVTLGALGQPVLAILVGGAAVAIWLAKPSFSVLRWNLAERLARRLGTTAKEKYDD